MSYFNNYGKPKSEGYITTCTFSKINSTMSPDEFLKK